jgi:hypothetical protein
MTVQWNQFIIRTSLWLLGEIALNLIGLDTLADYSEFVFEPHKMTALQELSILHNGTSSFDHPLTGWASYYRFRN